MDLFSISELSGYAGVKPHTIRAWEQRYGALQPIRSEGNTRYYDGRQLRRLLNIVNLTASGHSISKLGPLSDKRLSELITATINEPKKLSQAGYFIAQLLDAGMNFDESRLDRYFSESVSRFGLLNTYTRVIVPLLSRVGLLWSAEKITPCKEHFISHFIRRKLFAAVDDLPPPKPRAKTWLLFLPEDEYHDVGLLFTQYYIRHEGDRVIYLGSSIPFESLTDAIKTIKPNNVLFFMVHKESEEEINDYLEALNDITKGKRVFVCASGDVVSEKMLPKRFRHLSSVAALQDVIQGKKRS